MMPMASKATILVCCHKKDFFYSGNGFLPIQVGKSISNIDLGITGDNTGENISEKNPNFCELTAQYWAWKNNIDSEYIGLNHYRRYFNFNDKSKFGYFFQNIQESQANDNTLSLPNLDKIFNDADIVLAKPMVYPLSLMTHYAIAHNKYDLLALRKVIERIYPEYIPSFDKFINGNRISLCNMFIMRNEMFKDYSEWLFKILLTLEKDFDISKGSYQSRVFGFMAERLLNVYVLHNQLRIKYFPILKISDNRPLNNIKGEAKNILNNLAFSIIRNNSELKNRW